jgi:hypothetical protein
MSESSWINTVAANTSTYTTNKNNTNSVNTSNTLASNTLASNTVATTRSTLYSAQPSVLNLNEGQTKAYINIRKYIKNDDRHNFLLLGPAGSGKTTVIVNAFNASDENKVYKIAFCAFTNKATQVLKKIAGKFDINFQADFMTIHKLLSLELKYLDKETEVSFKFDKTKVASLKEYDIVIFDECSTISKELYQYICESWEYINFAYNHKLKYIFLGDYWQLPPVGEENSVIFQIATQNKWLIAKLDKVMRSGNAELEKINNNLLSWVNKFKSADKSLTDRFVHEYPYNMLEKTFKLGNKTMTRYLSNAVLLDKYLDTWQNVTPNTVILTYSRSNCDKTNQSIQDKIDDMNGREIPEKRSRITFYKGDRCCLDRPIEVYKIMEKKKGKTVDPSLFTQQDIFSSSKSTNDKDMSIMQIEELDDDGYAVSAMIYETDNNKKGADNKCIRKELRCFRAVDDYVDETDEFDANNITETKQATQSVKSNTIRTVMLDTSTTEMLYNGEIFDILEVENVRVVTALNRFQYMPKYFDAQLLTIVNISSSDKKYEIIHIPEEEVNGARFMIKTRERRMFYLNIMSDFIKKYPKLDYGYCITIYKSQGSEWDTVFVNLNSIKWSIVGQNNVASLSKKIALFKSTYTAMTRPTNNLYCFWSS